MKPDPDPTLHRDLFATAAARLRRSLRRRRLALCFLPASAAVAILATLSLRSSLPSRDPLALATPPLPASLPPAESPTPTAPPYQRLTTDQELLAALAAQGPMLITHSDGRKQLILTRP